METEYHGKDYLEFPAYEDGGGNILCEDCHDFLAAAAELQEHEDEARREEIAMDARITDEERRYREEQP
ncbi:MAG: hypothetical protein Q8Q12_00590 [bacterium]|nr:hypothetical protein [bacterium]